jgi:hypothetical protein
MDIPDEFKCCATGNIMDDPVTCDDGYTYDKNSIENLCHMISSKTFKKITTVIPNRALKNSIDRFKQDYPDIKKDINDTPEEFKCCVTGNIMVEPVTCDDGYTYDKNSIENLCHMISIKTFKKITTVIPNRALKNSIDRFREDRINIIIKKLDILLKSKQTKENELQFLQEDLDLTDVKLASIKS